MNEQVVETTEEIIYCNGGDNSKSHPKIYLNLIDEPDHQATCPYCSKHFILK